MSEAIILVVVLCVVCSKWKVVQGHMILSWGGKPD